MAIYNGPMASKMRGKVGEIVAAKTVGGQTALRAYQPKVKNPNTKRQQVSRNKFAKASGLAAVFSAAIAIGHAKAVAGAKMYARNMFVKDIVPTSSGVFIVNGTDVTVDGSKLWFSKPVGINVKPIIDINDGTGGETKDFSVRNRNMVVLPAGSSLGLVVVLADEKLEESRVFTGMADEGVKVPVAVLSELASPVFWAFYKEVPEAFNGVDAEEIPWKYPSLTGPCTAKEAVD